MSAIYKSEAGARAVRKRYLRYLDHWPVPSERTVVPTREGETFVLACGPKEERFDRLLVLRLRQRRRHPQHQGP